MSDGDDVDRYYDDLLDRRIDRKWHNFSWTTLRALVSAANDVIARGAGALVNDRRQRWVAAQRSAGVLDEFPDLVVDLKKRLEPRSFLIVGDPGEADASQYAVACSLREVGEDTDFMLIASDVVYPAGDVNDYVNALYVPYEEYEQPIYAIPGNHDWYDGLEGFMFHFCGADALPPVLVDPTSYGLRERIWRRLWRRASAPKRAFLHYFRSRRAPWVDNPSARHQPGPYFAFDLDELLVVCVDTGVTGELDAEQGDWLRRISGRREQAKLLVTGRPIYVDNERHPGEIDDYRPEWDNSPEPHRFVDEIVRDPEHRYIAAIGADVHNYQHYAFTDGGERPFHYFVAGGGGAYLGNTHKIRLREDADAPFVDRPADHIYPSAAESLQLFAGQLLPEVWRTVLRLVLTVLGGVAAAVPLFLLHRSNVLSEFREVGVLAGAAAVIVLLGVLVGFVDDPVRRERLRHFAFPGLGALIVFLTAFVTTDHDWKAFDGDHWWWTAPGLIALVILVAGVGFISRIHRLRNWGPVGTAGLAILAAWYLIALEVGYEVLCQAALGAFMLVAVPVITIWVDRKLGRAGYPGKDDTEPSGVQGLPRRPKRQRPDLTKRWPKLAHRARGPLLAFVLVGWLAGLYLIWELRDEQAAIAILVSLGVVVHIPVLLAFVSYLERLTPNKLFWTLVAYAAFWATVVATTEIFGDGWIWRYSVGLLCALAALVALALAAYLFWLRGFGLLFRRNARARSGSLSIVEANSFLLWHRYGAAVAAGKEARRCRPDDPIPELPPEPPAPDRHTKLVGRIVVPSWRKIRSPVHRLIAEIFEAREPPFYKSFLRVDVLDDAVRITCFAVTGCKQEPEGEHEIVIPLPS